MESGKSIILDREQAIRDGPKILQDHAITFDRSIDLQNYSSQGKEEQLVDCPDGQSPEGEEQAMND